MFLIALLSGCFVKPDPPSLVAWIPLDDPTGTTAFRDLTGNDHIATCTACPTRIIGHRGGPVRQFDGATQYLSIASTPLLDLTGTFTIALWTESDDVRGSSTASSVVASVPAPKTAISWAT